MALVLDTQGAILPWLGIHGLDALQSQPEHLGLTGPISGRDPQCTQLRDGGRTLCYTKGAERCTSLAATSGGKLTVGLSTAFAGSACAVLSYDGLPSIWTWSPGSAVIGRAAYLAGTKPRGALPGPTFHKLADGSFVLATQRLEFWRP